jgi:hypothetical protein
MNTPYDDIIHLSRPVSSRHAPMPMIDRAAQFAPFAALTGYDAAIRETARLTDAAAELDESMKAALNEQLTVLQNTIESQPVITVLYFEDDRRKAGGHYRTITGNLKKIDAHNGQLLMTDGNSILFSQIYRLNTHLTAAPSALCANEE